MTKEELIEALKLTLQPGESGTVEGSRGPESLTNVELADVFFAQDGTAAGLRAVVMADRRREVWRMREEWGMATQRVHWADMAKFLGVKVTP